MTEMQPGAGDGVPLENLDSVRLGELFSEHRDRLLRLVQFRMDPRLHGRVDADDVLQEAYLAASNRLKHYVDSDQSSPFIWLRMIVCQTLIDLHRHHIGAQMRSAGREKTLKGGHDANQTSLSLVAKLLGHMTSPSQAAMRMELSIQLEEALGQMSPVDQEVLALRHFEELSNQETAEVLGIQPKAASIRYIRAIARLKDVLAKIPGFFEQADE